MSESTPYEPSNVNAFGGSESFEFWKGNFRIIEKVLKINFHCTLLYLSELNLTKFTMNFNAGVALEPLLSGIHGPTSHDNFHRFVGHFDLCYLIISSSEFSLFAEAVLIEGHCAGRRQLSSPEFPKRYFLSLYWPRAPGKNERAEKALEKKIITINL